MNDGTSADVRTEEADTDIGWADGSAKAAASSAIPAAKLHVLGLVPLKARLGPKWERLSDLVHKLFETAIARAQGPGDHVIKLDELSYALTFHKLSLGEANLACIAIAKEVCQMLFGNQIDEISVRSIVGSVVNLRSVDVRRIGETIEAVVEATGSETVVTQRRASDSSEPVIALANNVTKPPVPFSSQIDTVHSLLRQRGLKMGFLPAWDLRKKICNTLFLSPYLESAKGIGLTGFDAIRKASEGNVGDIEIFLLDALAAYASRIEKANKVCAFGIGVSYLTLTMLRTRIRYITVLQKTLKFFSAPLLLKIERIPDGAPMPQLAELIAMMRLPNVHPVVEFANISNIPKIDFALRAVGMGGACPRGLDYDGAWYLAEKLVRSAASQKAFSFLDRLDSGELADAATQAGIKFGMGMALPGGYYTGLEAVPDFPMMFAEKNG